MMPLGHFPYISGTVFLGMYFCVDSEFQGHCFLDILSMATELISSVRLASPLSVNCYWAP